jgi:hypothetical protein
MNGKFGLPLLGSAPEVWRGFAGARSVARPSSDSDDPPRHTTRPEDTVRNVHIAIELLTPGERRDLANALLRAAWGAALEETQILLLDLAIATDEQLLWEFA